VATSHYTKKDLVKFYGINRSKIEVIYQDCHPQFYLNPISDAVLDKYTLQKPYILCVGTIEKRKQQLELVQAFASIQFGGELILVGKKTKYYSKIAQYLTENPQLEQRVRVIENADFQDFPSIYAHAHLFVYPSVCEGFGIPILEAMNTKTAVLTTKKTVMEEVGDDAVAYYTKYSVASLTETMQELVDDSNYRNKLINKGLERALLFRKEINLDQLHQLYHTL
jgi:glycosyltransferase involved in cell wall biosynthesis